MRLDEANGMTESMITIAPLEVEPGFPTFRALFILELPHRSGRFRYEGTDIWLGTDAIDGFQQSLQQLAAGEAKECSLADLGNSVQLQVQQQEEAFQLTISISEPNTGSGGGALNYHLPLSKKGLQNLIHRFVTFPRWWEAMSQDEVAGS
ncbi:Hypothetical protein PBC10988_8860 [Planctomycetales bacterium 10988]|nr:Hypothetical protein PBC10988_8860 [Planctomycetales bacterium 10988]